MGASLYERSLQARSVRYMATYRCSLACERCDTWRFRGSELTTTEARGMIGELSALGVRSLRFCGGDPLLRPDIGELISHCNKMGVRAALMTNGSLLPEMVRELKGASILIVHLSWQDCGCARDEAYEKAKEGIRAAKKAGLRVAASAVLTRENIRAIPALAADAHELGIWLSFFWPQRYGHSADNSRIEAMMPAAEEREEALRLLEALRKDGGRVCSPHRLLCSSRPVAQAIQGGGVWSLTVTPSGDVAPCFLLSLSRSWPSGIRLGFGRAIDEVRELLGAASGRIGMERPHQEPLRTGSDP